MVTTTDLHSAVDAGPARSSEPPAGPAGPPGRLRRGQLSRERVLTAALGLVEREGAGALSMRRVAAEIGTAPMSLYRHVRDKADLVDGVIALALRGLSTGPFEGADWSDRARSWMQALREGMTARPAIVGMLRADHMMLPAVLAPVEMLIGDLEDAGFARDEASARGLGADVVHALVRECRAEGR